jgi:hypothetical protein
MHLLNLWVMMTLLPVMIMVMLPLSWLLLHTVTEPPREGVRRQDQLEQFSMKREHNQHI